MERREAEIEWMLNEDIRLEVRLENGVPTGDVRVYAEDGKDCWLTMSPDRTELLFDGRYVDVGDDYPRFLGIMDAANEGVTFIGDCLAPGHPEPEDEYGRGAGFGGQDITYDRPWSSEPGGYHP